METILTVTLLGLIQAQVYMPVIAPKIAVASTFPTEMSSTTIREKIIEKSLPLKVNAKQIIKTIECESGYNTKAVGDNGDSIGLTQINLPSHPDISREQAEDPNFSIDFITSEFSKGNQWKWSCWKKYFGSNSS